MSARDLTDVPGARIVLEAERAAVRVVSEPSRTLSADAMDELLAEMGAFVASRMLRAMDRQRVPHRVTVHLFVELDGEAAE
jgi:pyruvate kinase